MPRSISAIIVNYRTPELTIACVRSLLAEERIQEIIVVDNPAPEPGDNNDQLRRAFERASTVKFIFLDTNRGFGGGNNAGAQIASGEYLFFINSDATLEEGALEPLVKMMDEKPHVGLVAPPVYLPHTHTLQPDVCGTFPTPLKIITRQTRSWSTSESPDWISGVSFIARREEFIRMGGFDEHMFMYFEDIELCHRYARFGFSVARFSSGPGIVHLGGASRTSTKKQKRAYYTSQDYYLRKVGFSAFSRAAVAFFRFFYVLLTGR